MSQAQRKRCPAFQLPRERLDFLGSPPMSASRPFLTSRPVLTPRPEPEPDPKLEPESAPELDAASFHAVLRECARQLEVEGPKSKQAESTPRARAWLGLTQSRTLSGLTRIWSWLHARYPYASARRMRVAETLSLGDKRFVAIVSVEDREFLIGGAASNVSLLAQWGKLPDSADGRRGFGAGGTSR